MLSSCLHVALLPVCGILTGGAYPRIEAGQLLSCVRSCAAGGRRGRDARSVDSQDVWVPPGSLGTSSRRYVPLTSSANGLYTHLSTHRGIGGEGDILRAVVVL